MLLPHCHATMCALLCGVACALNELLKKQPSRTAEIIEKIYTKIMLQARNASRKKDILVAGVWHLQATRRMGAVCGMCGNMCAYVGIFYSLGMWTPSHTHHALLSLPPSLFARMIRSNPCELCPSFLFL